MINTKCDELQQWLHSNANASKAEYEQKKKELEDIYNPIATKIYGQQGQGFPGAGPQDFQGGQGGFPGAQGG